MNRNKTRRLAFNLSWMMALVLFVPSIVGCPYPICRTSDQRASLIDFDDVCEGQPCDWEAEVGMISSVPTFHSELVGMRVEEGTRAVRTREIAVPPSSESMMVRATVSCDPGASISVEALVQPDAPGPTSPTPASRESTVRLRPVDDMNTSGFQVVESGLGTPGRILELRVETTGGACIIDDLEILTSRTVC